MLLLWSVQDIRPFSYTPPLPLITTYCNSNKASKSSVHFRHYWPPPLVVLLWHCSAYSFFLIATKAFKMACEIHSKQISSQRGWLLHCAWSLFHQEQNKQCSFYRRECFLSPSLQVQYFFSSSFSHFNQSAHPNSPTKTKTSIQARKTTARRFPLLSFHILHVLIFEKKYQCRKRMYSWNWLLVIMVTDEFQPTVWYHTPWVSPMGFNGVSYACWDTCYQNV